MEALEEKYVKHDSFEEVDRILIIVENSKSEFERARSSIYFQFTAMTVFTMALILSLSGTIDILKGNRTKPDYINFIDPAFMMCTVALLTTFIIVMLSSSYNRYRKNRAYYKSTIKAAAEVIRELVPTLSRSEKWSSLRKFELKLRLSKLDISSEKLFSENAF